MSPATALMPVPERSPRVIDAIFAAHGMRGPWTRLPALGIANEIYATPDVVLRLATDHPQAEPDARTESVAAPAAHAVGIRTPRLVAFDDSRSLVERPYSLWERVHGETLGAITLVGDAGVRLWREVGRELARLHLRVSSCDDPHGWLDSPARTMDLADAVQRLRHSGQLGARAARDLVALIRDLQPLLHAPAPRFVHDDVHPWNIMCSGEGELLAIIDWGDAGWGDPALDFGYVPIDHLPAAREGYESEAPGVLGECPEARFAWDHLQHGLERMVEYGMPAPDVRALSGLLGR